MNQSVGKPQGPILVLGGTGKTGRRVAERLTKQVMPIRIGSRSSKLPFNWNDQATWRPLLEGISAVYISYYPDLASPGSSRFYKMTLLHT
ncbi:hypothetical protein [Amphibacillus sediminis]|uniref:hypothetical protein n=1 Tax=Amphibacillus sediminis TaxID=360185 RepID=UPI000830EB78|nr:hypothetical protein [Amphibacillus sediminis]